LGLSNPPLIHALCAGRHRSKELEVEVLGSQTLADIRDQLYCLSDLQLNAQPGNSATMFIEGAFFDDMRDPQNTRLSMYVRCGSLCSTRIAGL
jgi:hypothetical protein